MQPAAGAIALVTGMALLATWTPEGVLVGVILIVTAFVIRDY